MKCTYMPFHLGTYGVHDKPSPRSCLVCFSDFLFHKSGSRDQDDGLRESSARFLPSHPLTYMVIIMVTTKEINAIKKPKPSRLQTQASKKRISLHFYSAAAPKCNCPILLVTAMSPLNPCFLTVSRQH